MAFIKYTMSDDFMKQLENLEKNSMEIIEKMLNAGGEIGLDAVRSELAGVVGKVTNSRSTGELQASLGLTPAKKDRNGIYNVKIGFNEPRRRQPASGKIMTNAEIANVLEYGKSGQRPRPFIINARLKSGKAIEAAMQAEFDKAAK